MYCKPWKCVWCSSRSRSKGSKTETLHWTLEEETRSVFLFVWFVGLLFLLWTISKWISLLLQNVCLLSGGTGLAAPRSLLSPSELTGEGSILPSASCLWFLGCRAGAPQRSTSSRTPSDPPEVPESSSRKTGQSRLSTANAVSKMAGGGCWSPPLLDPAVIPAVSPVPQFFDTLAGRCNSHISGNLLPVCFFFFFFLLCFRLLFCRRYGGLRRLAADRPFTVRMQKHFGQRCLCSFILCQMQKADQRYRALLIVSFVTAPTFVSIL